MGRPLVPWIGGGLALAALVLGTGCERELDVCGSGAHDRRPSIVLIAADTLRADYLGRSHGESAVSPTLDAFATEAVAFPSTYAQAPWTKPSVASLLTGLHPHVHGVMNHEGWFSRPDDEPGADRVGVLPAEIDTLAERLGRAGYQSAAFVANEWLAPGYGYEQGFDHYELVPRDRLGAVFARADRWLSERDPSRPFFLYLHLMEVHGPYDAPAPFVEAARGALGASAAEPLGDGDFAKIPEYLRASAWAREPAAHDLREWRTRYAAGVVAFDSAFSVFLGRARSQGWLEDSVVVVTADHGEELFDHGGWDHGTTLFDELLHVPLLVRLPGGQKGGRSVDAIASLIDVEPTLLELAGLEAPARSEDTAPGRSLAPALCGVAGDLAPERTFASAAKQDPALYSLRTDRYKLILDTRSGAGALFDLAADPGERRDVAASERETAEALAQELWRHVAAVRGVRRPVATAPVDPGMRARLEALGYAEPRAER